LSKFAAAGHYGKCSSNVDRDQRNFLRRARFRFGFHLQPYSAEMTLQNPRGKGSMTQEHEVLLVHETMHALHKQGGRVWQEGFLGGDGDRFGEFWRRDEENFPGHPVHAETPAVKSMIAAVGLHGDDVADVQDDKMCVLTWNSIVAKRLGAWDSRFVFALLPWRLMYGRVTLWQLLEIFVWSVKRAMSGYFPYTDHLGKPFKKGSWRSHMAGKPIAGGFRAAFAEMRADNDFFAVCYGWCHYRCNNICHRCWASAVNPEMPWTDVGPDAAWRSALVSTVHFLQNVPVCDRCPLVGVPGWCIERNVIDAMHGLHLGPDQHVCGNIIWDWVTEAVTYKKYIPDMLESIWMEFLDWCRNRRVSCSLKRLTIARLNMSKAGSYPLLGCKAAEARILVSFLTEKALMDARGKPRCVYTQFKAICIWPLDRFHHICDENDDPFPPEAQKECVEVLDAFLTCYAKLREYCISIGDPGWHMVPKHHYLCHLRDDVARTACNPSHHHCFVDEDMVGRVARGSRKLHRSTVTVRWLERYIHMMWLRWRA